MIITRSPFRISFFGGGTDYPDWYLSEGGAVLSTSINKYCYITCRYLPPFFENSFRIVWSHIEPVSTIEEILHPAVREGLWFSGFDNSKGVEIHHQGDLPARSGMGSSSAFCNALLLGLAALSGKNLSHEELYKLSIELEQKRLNESVGSQDQVATAVGGLNLVKFKTSGEIDIARVEVSQHRADQLNDNLMLFYSGTSRFSSHVASDIIRNLKSRASELRVLEEMAHEADAILKSDRPINDFGRLLDEAWRLKRKLSSKIASPHIDQIYEAAMSAGALGGKVLGAGGAGFMLFYVPKEKQVAVREVLDNLLYVPFRFESEGAQVMLSSSDLDPSHRFSETAI